VDAVERREPPTGDGVASREVEEPREFTDAVRVWMGVEGRRARGECECEFGVPGGK
jgi:hypothetical protein